MLSKSKNICSLFDQSCLLCNAKHSTTPVCTNCMDDLPWATHACYQCALPLPTHTPGYICGVCLKHPPTYTNTTAAFFYSFPISAIMPRLKHIHELYHHQWLTAALAQQIQNRHQTLPEALIPIPVHASRRFVRGYNQSERIAKVLSNTLNIPCDIQSLTKNRPSRAQSTLDGFNRRQNLRATFSYDGPLYGHVALIDDVMTTGTTVKVASQLLRKTGIKQIDIWVLARTPEPR